MSNTFYYYTSAFAGLQESFCGFAAGFPIRCVLNAGIRRTARKIRQQKIFLQNPLTKCIYNVIMCILNIHIITVLHNPDTVLRGN